MRQLFNPNTRFFSRVASKSVKAGKYLVRSARRVEYYRKVHNIDRSHISGLLIFVGNARSGTTLMRSLIDAHQNVAISNEYNVLHNMCKNKSWSNVSTQMLVNTLEFNQNPCWTGYHYNLKKNDLDSRNLQVIGDKKSSHTAQILLNDFSIIDRLHQWSPVPVLFLHCIRNPYDVIARKTCKNKRSLEKNIQVYFAHEKIAIKVADKIGKSNVFQVVHEELIANPDQVLRNALNFMGLSVEDSYLSACRELIFDQPKMARHDVRWSATAIANVQQQTRQLEHLSGYLDEGQLIL